MTQTFGSLSGAVIVVTGGASGIGLAVAAAACSAGASGLMLADRSRTALDDASRTLATSETKVATQQVDVTDPAAVEELVSRTLSTFGRVDGLVTSAGVEQSVPALELSDDAFDAVVGVNLKGTFSCARGFAPTMIETGGGSIVTIGSALAFSGRANGAHYSASKGGVVALTKSLALEWGPSAIRVNSVAPGVIDTPLASRVPAEYRAAYVSRTPLGRIGTPEDVAAVARFLLSADSGYVTGQTVVVNGGFLMPS
ncbi:SDR family NAD(P)-dependent oxidoreductase [Mycobacterium sp. CVI_P3]|uniref:SDR family NAD(P)-dependent oxidoreductase n=1 Tax=Mycobacterium pinniadriaticum TaxID=2994102 RepID=A0ABT3SLY5_9MYCO|nr:SDR family NAD(P)-dependent oxidoreductase [Mycobacterium pinniadriaticum]MCX2933746.1 SDR family NAD(P)-dependent oxidoreductase [Mycobacterium pinniadriaticum]MCX2940168.1 SDR family NAD(P)-dependent oxidoreductase [Mycobacterium pinniadriaticum]